MMPTIVQNRYDYTGYIKCGEILRPPCESTTRPYALKCFYCKEIYLLFEAFIFHIEDHCKNAIAQMAQDSTSKQSEPLGEDNKNGKKISVACDTEEENPAVMKTEEEPSAVIKSGSDSGNEDILIKTDNIEASSSSIPLRSESPLNGSCSSKKLSRPRRQTKALEKCTDNISKTTNVAWNDIRAYIGKRPSRKVIKTDNDNVKFDNINKKTTKNPSIRIVKAGKKEVEFESCEKKVKQESNINKNCKAIDHNFESHPTCVKEEPDDDAYNEK